MTAVFHGTETDEPNPDDEGAADQAHEAPPDPSGQKGGWILDHPEPKEVKEYLLALVKHQKPYRRARRAKEDRWERLRAGESGLTIQPLQDESDYFVRRDFGEGAGSVTINNTPDQLIRRTAAVITTDPPLATVTANTGEDKERLASELAERILRVEGAAVNRDDAGTLRRAIDLAGTYGSIFNWFTVDPQGGGLHPVEIQAHPQATTIKDALTPTIPGPPMIGPDGMAVEGQPVPIPNVTVADLITRYVTIDGRLTDVQAEAKLAPRLAIREQLIRPAQVTLLPFGADVQSAIGCLVGEVLPLYEVVARFYGGVRPEEEVVKKLTAWKPAELDYYEWMPKNLRATMRQTPQSYPGNDAIIADDALCAILCVRIKSSELAPMGAYVVIGGTDEPLIREPWRVTIGDGPDAQVKYLSLGLTQLRWREDSDGDPYGVPGIEDLAATSAQVLTLTEYVLNHCYKAANGHVYIEMGSSLQPDEYLRRDGMPINIKPGSQPFFEEIPPLESIVTQLLEAKEQELEKVSGLNSAAATGEAPASVNSGTQLAQVIEETRVGLTGNIQNSDRYYVATCDTRLEFFQGFIDAPQMLTYTGESGDVQQQAFMGADLLGYGDIQIAKDSSTMMTRTAKAQLAQNNLDLALKTGDAEGVQSYKENLAQNQNPQIGIQDDPIKARIQRQVFNWKQAAQHPQESTAAAGQGVPETTALPSSAPAQAGPDGQPLPPPIPPEVQAALAHFQPNITDELEDVAMIRFRALKLLCASKAYDTAPQPFQQAAQMEYERMRQAAGIMTRAEQQLAAQQAAQQQADQAAMQGDKAHAQKQEQSAQSHAQAMEQNAAKAPPMVPSMQGLPA